MMPYKIYEYVAEGGAKEFSEWKRRLQKPLLARLDQKIDMLRKHGDELVPNTLTDSGVGGILKLRVQGGVKLRPLLCRGPIDHGTEYTFLFGAKEIGNKWSPLDAREQAAKRKDIVKTDPHKRRVHSEQ